MYQYLLSPPAKFQHYWLPDIWDNIRNKAFNPSISWGNLIPFCFWNIWLSRSNNLFDKKYNSTYVPNIIAKNGLAPLQINTDSMKVIDMITNGHLPYNYIISNRLLLHQLGNSVIWHSYREQKLFERTHFLVVPLMLSPKALWTYMLWTIFEKKYWHVIALVFWWIMQYLYISYIQLTKKKE